MKGLRSILLGIAAVGALALAGAWWAMGAIAERQANKLLDHSQSLFVQLIENSLDAVLWYAGSLGGYFLDYSTAPRSAEEMQNLAELLYVDELTMVGTNGIAIASNYPEYVGFDWHTTPETAAYLELFDPKHKVAQLLQPFRPCVINHANYLKFGGVVFTNRLGLVQVGYSMDRLVATMALTESRAFRRWKFGRYGRFGAFDRDGDELPDPVEATRAVADGMSCEKVIADDGVWYRRTFPFAGRSFYAEVPEREFSYQRWAAFLIAAALILIVLALFTVLLVRLQLSSAKVEKLHREAARRVAADLTLAHTIQMSTLPRVPTFAPGQSSYALDALMVPAREVGGDFYDFFTLADGRLALVIGDVSGKGVPAAMFMLVAKNAVRRALHDAGDPAAAMAAVNAALCADNEAGMFVTMVLAILDSATGALDYVNAGHNRPFVVRADGAVERLEVRGGRLLGLFPNLTYASARVRLAAGDRFFLYTDGVTEAMDTARRLYGEARLKERLAARPEPLCAAVRADVAQHVAGAAASDDLTMLSLTWKGSMP